MDSIEQPSNQLDGRDPVYERYRWQVFAVTWLAYAGFYLTRKSFSVAKIELAKPEVFGMSTSEMAWIDGAYLVCYATGQFVWGISGDRFGTRKVILSGMFCSIVVAVLAGTTSATILLMILFACQGLCQSTGWAPLTKNISNFFSRRERGRAMGVWCTNYAFGGFLASGIAGWSAESLGWRFAFWIPAALLAVIWLLFYLLQVNRPEDVGLPPIEEYHDEKVAVLVEGESPEEERDGSWKVIAEVLTNRMVWLLCAVYLFLKPTRYLVLFWSPVYINERLGTGATSSGLLGSMFELAGPVGVIVGGYVSDKWFNTRRMPACVISLVIVALVMFNFYRLPSTPLALGLGFLAIGFFLYIPDSIVSGTAAIDFGTRRGASTAAGLVNGFGSIGAVAGGTMPGWIDRVTGSSTDIWGNIFSGLAIALLISAVLLLPKWNALPQTANDSN